MKLLELMASPDKPSEVFINPAIIKAVAWGDNERKWVIIRTTDRTDDYDGHYVSVESLNSFLKRLGEC